MKNIMLDLETLGNGNDAVILSIGAVKFDPKTNTLGDEYYQLIQPKTCTDAGLKMDTSTVMWWFKQSHEARAAFANESDMHPLADVLDDFANWIGDHTTALIWGNGANFDNVILSNAYKACGKATPWPYWGDRCYRTVSSLKRDIKRQRIGTHHNALDDAKTQAQHLMDILAGLYV